MIPRVKGTQDFLNLTLFNFIISAVKKHVSSYHFTEIQTPLIEYLNLFQRSLGEHTDVVAKEMFIIESKHAESEDRLCLRPEMTAPIVRAFVDNNIQQIPWKIFSYGPCFRYERPQKGRYRQFHQITMEIIGSSSVAQDVQFIMMLDRFFHEVLHINSYALAINFLGCLEDRANFRIILKKFMDSDQAKGVCSQCQERKEHNILRIFDCKNIECQVIYRNAPKMTDHLCSQCEQEWHQLQQQLSLLSVSHVHKPTLVRGLDYYNKTVFEFVSKSLGAQDAFCGGGRYNQLAQELGASQDYPSIGAAIGMERLILLLEPYQERLMLPILNTLHIIIPITSDQHVLALLVADTLREHELCVDVIFEGSLKSMFRKASKLGAAYVLVLGETEQQERTVVIKNMVTGKEESVLQIDAAQFLKK
jgi:histidyl-tRNA synthetase